MLSSYSASSSLQLLNQILIADITTLRMRGLVNSLATVPFLVNAPIGAFVSAALLQQGRWRLGCKRSLCLQKALIVDDTSDAIFAVLIPIVLAPLVGLLLWTERKASNMGLVPDPDGDAPTYEGIPGDEPVAGVDPANHGNISPLSPLRRDPGVPSHMLRSPPSPELSRRRRSRPMSGVSCTYLQSIFWAAVAYWRAFF
jgi:hypothetical protein